MAIVILEAVVLRETPKTLLVRGHPLLIPTSILKSCIEPTGELTPFSQPGARGRLDFDRWWADKIGLGLAAVEVAPDVEVLTPQAFAADIELTEEQEAACGELLNARVRVAVLVGAAGTGKTTLMYETAKRLVAEGTQVQLAAPTGKACVRLMEATGLPARTLHSCLYGQVEEDRRTGKLTFSEPRAPCVAGAVLIVDESSMVNKRMAKLLYEHLPDDSRIIYVGDREQLPPVEGTWGPDFGSPTAALEQIHRQAVGSPIIALATAVRTGGKLSGWTGGDDVEVGRGTQSDAVEWLVDQRRAGTDATLITFTNARRQQINAQVRRELGLDKAAVSVGDRLLVLQNNHSVGLMNGEVHAVDAVTLRSLGIKKSLGDAIDFTDGEIIDLMADVELSDAGRPACSRVSVLPQLMGITRRAWLDHMDDIGAGSRRPKQADYDDYETWLRASWNHKVRAEMYRNLIRADFGECLTCHKSQGSSWHSVGIVVGSSLQQSKKGNAEAKAFYKRWMYTAITRARTKLRIWFV